MAKKISDSLIQNALEITKMTLFLTKKAIAAKDASLLEPRLMAAVGLLVESSRKYELSPEGQANMKLLHEMTEEIIGLNAGLLTNYEERLAAALAEEMGMMGSGQAGKKEPTYLN